jgi:hypothetical protein
VLLRIAPPRYSEAANEHCSAVLFPPKVTLNLGQKEAFFGVHIILRNDEGLGKGPFLLPAPGHISQVTVTRF